MDAGKQSQLLIVGLFGIFFSRASGAYGPEETEDTITVPLKDFLMGRYFQRKDVTEKKTTM